jgi:hypothetical protein
LPSPLWTEADQDHVAFPETHVERGRLPFDLFSAYQISAAQRAAVGNVTCEHGASEARLRIEYFIALEHNVRLRRQPCRERMLFHVGPQDRAGAEKFIGPQARDNIRHRQTEPLDWKRRRVA